MPGIDGLERYQSVRLSANFATRTATAVVLGPLFLAMVIWGGPLFAVLIAVLAVICIREWVRLVVADPTVLAAPTLQRGALWLSYAAIGAIVAVEILIGEGWALTLVVATCLGVWLILMAWKVAHATTLSLGIAYVGLGAMAVIWLHGQVDKGPLLVVWLMTVVWGADIGGYVVGKLVGGARLAPAISPNKTWAGVVGGIVLATTAGGLVGWAMGADRLALALALAAGLAVGSQLGDLFESFTKRRFGAKDSGDLIPGHGGLLDRVDGVLAAAPILALFQATLGGVLAWW